MGQHHSISNAEKSKAKTSVTREDIQKKSPITKQETKARDKKVPQDPPPAYSPRVPRLYSPDELVHKVAQYLDPVSKLCLRYTSRHLFQCFKLKKNPELGSLLAASAASSRLVSQIRDSGPRARESRRAPQYDLKREGRLQLLRHLLKDGFFGDGKAICGACLAVHEDGLFLPVELEKGDAERRCKGLTGKVWVCPHRSLTYEQVTLRNPIPTDYECFACTSIHVTTPSQSSSRICFPIKRLDGSATSVPKKAEVADILSLLGSASICPHLSVSTIFPRYWCHLHSNDPVDGLPHYCEYCRACFSFDLEPTDGSGGASLLRLVVQRDFRQIKGVTDPMWVTQLVQKERVVEESRAKWKEPVVRWDWKLDAMKEAWTTTEQECRRVMWVGYVSYDRTHEWYDCPPGKTRLKA